MMELEDKVGNLATIDVLGAEFKTMLDHVS